MPRLRRTRAHETSAAFGPQDTEDDEPRLAVAMASTPNEVEDLCRTAYEAEGYAAFSAAQTVEGHLPAPRGFLALRGKSRHSVGAREGQPNYAQANAPHSAG